MRRLNRSRISQSHPHHFPREKASGSEMPFSPHVGVGAECTADLKIAPTEIQCGEELTALQLELVPVAAATVPTGLTASAQAKFRARSQRALHGVTASRRAMLPCT